MAKKGLGRKAYEAARALLTRRIEFTFENLPVSIPHASYRRIFNWLLAETAAQLRTPKPWGFPTHVQVEPASRCNQRCQYCPVSQETAESTGHLDFETFRKFADSLGEYPLIFQLWGWGEPFLNREVYDMIRYAKQRNIRTISSTNAELFERREKAEQLVASGLDMLIIAISGISQETYGAYRPGSEWRRVYEGIRNIEAEKRRQASRLPLTSLTFIVNATNEQEAPHVGAMARELDVDAYTLKKLNPTSTRSERWQGHTAIAADPSLVRLKYKDGQPVRARRNPCKSLWQGTTLRWNGKINPCPYDFHGKYELGDASKQEFVQIWGAGEYQKMRDDFRADWNRISICENCIHSFEGGEYHEALAQTVFMSPRSSV